MNVVLAVSNALADELRGLGARDVRVVPNGVELPDSVGEEAEPPEILFAGRLSREKGILELVEAARGHKLVVAGDGPLRARVPEALGWLPPDELASLYARAAVVACPSHREGFGVACAEAMAHGRAVVASDVGGLRDLVVDGETGLLVPPRDPAALRGRSNGCSRTGSSGAGWGRTHGSAARALLVGRADEATSRPTRTRGASGCGSRPRPSPRWPARARCRGRPCCCPRCRS